MSKVTPEGWSIRTLDGNICVQSGFPFKSSLFTDDSSLMGVIRIRDLEKQNVETFYAGDYDEAYIVKKGDILIGMDGDFNIVKWGVRDALLNQRVCKVKAEPNSNFYTKFLFHSLEEDLTRINAATGATTVKHLSVSDIRGIEKAYPPLPEQQKIATILSSVDNVIEKTRAQIDKLKDLKAGMMQELLTKGIGHTEFKDSPVGLIPASWQITKIGEVSKVKRGASPRPIQDPKWWGGKVGWVRISDVTSSRKYLTKTTQYLSDAGVSKSVQIPKGEVVLSICATIGRPIIVKVDACIHDGFVWFEKLKGSIDREFWYYFLVSKEEYLGSQRQSGTQGNLNTGIVSELDLPLPPQHEQEKIAAIMASIDIKIEKVLVKLSKLENQKKALMQDLLTGKVRVTPDEPAAR